MSNREMPVEEARKRLGDLVIAAMGGESTILTRYGRPAAMLVPYTEEPAMTVPHTLTIVRGEQPDANGEEFGTAGLDVSDDVYAWFASNGVDDDSDVWVLVTPADEPVNAVNVIASREV